MAVDFSDSFNRANGGLGSAWSNLASSFSITSNQVAAASTLCFSYWNGGTPAADCYTKIKAVTNVPPTGFTGVFLRLDTSTFNVYTAEWDTSGCNIWRYDGGSPTALGATGFTAPADGDTVELRIVGSTITLYYNGTLQQTRTDSTYSAAGRSGMLATGTAVRVDDFETGTPVTNIDGALSSTLGTATLSGTGKVDISGTASATLAAATITAAGKLDITGTASPTLDDVSLTATATIASTPIDGALSQTLADATIAATGGLELAATLSATLADVIASGAAAIDVAGTLSATLGNATISTTGAVDLVGTLSGTLDDVTLSASGEGLVSGDGALTATLADVTVAATGTVDIAGALTQTLGNVTASGAAGLAVNGSLSQTLGNATVTATGAALIQGTLAKTLDDATLVADSLIDAGITAALSVTLADATAAATGVLPIVGLVGATLDDAVLSAQGLDPNAVHASSDGGGAGKRRPTAQQWLRLDEQLNKSIAERAERMRPATPSRAARTKARIVAQVAEITSVDENAAERLRDLWKRWYQAELRVGQTAPDVAYNRFAADLASYMADQQMESEIEEMLILMAVVALL